MRGMRGVRGKQSDDGGKNNDGTAQACLLLPAKTRLSGSRKNCCQDMLFLVGTFDIFWYFLVQTFLLGPALPAASPYAQALP